METRLATLRTRQDLFARTAKWTLLACMILWLCSICFYDTAADPGADQPKILLPTRLAYGLLLADISPLPIQRICGGPATLFGLGSFAASLLVVGLIALGWVWLNRAQLSRTGAVLTLASLPLWMLTFEASGRAVYPTFVRSDAFDRLTEFIETRQPGAIARLSAGGRLSLPDDAGGQIRLQSRPAEARALSFAGGDGKEGAIRDQVDAEALRFALAQRAMFAGDQATLRRLLPIRLAMRPADQPAANDIAQRLAALGRAAGAAPVPAEQAAWVAAGEASWLNSLRLIRINRIGIQITLVLGLVTLLIAQILKRRIGTIERHAITAAAEEPKTPPTLAPTFGRRRAARDA